MSSSFIGRYEEKKRICSILNKKNGRQPAIISIGGPGGVGKSTLLNEVLDDITWEENSNLVIKVANNDIKPLEKIIEYDFLKCAKTVLDGGYGYFKETERVLKLIQEIDIEIEKNFRKEIKKAKKFSDSEVDSIVNIMFAIGKGVNHYVSKTEEYINFSKIEKNLDNDIKNIWRKVNNEFTNDIFSNLIPDFKGRKGLQEKIRGNMALSLATALDNDLHTVLYGAKNLKQKVKPTQSKIKKYDKLLVVFEDFENKQDIMHEFLIEHFLQNYKMQSLNQL